MVAQKRKQPHDDGAKSAAQDAAPTRRSTRQHPGAASQPEHHPLRSGRARAAAVEQPPGAVAVVTRASSRVTISHAPPQAALTLTPTPTPTKSIQTRAKATRDKDKDKGTTTSAPRPEDITPAVSPTSKGKENVQPPTPTPPDDAKRRISQSAQSTQSKSRRHTRRTRSRSRSRSPPRPIQTQPESRSPFPSQSRARAFVPRPSQQPQRPIPAAPGFGSGSASGSSETPVVGAATVTPKRSRTSIHKSSNTPKPPGTPRSDRNIDKVVFGSTSFTAWYPSYYGKEVLGDVPANVGGGSAKIGGGKRDPPMLDRLYVCPCCFKYSKEMVPWWKHVRSCEKKAFVPGTKVYTHPRHSKIVSSPRTTSTLGGPAGAAKGKGKDIRDSSNQSADVSTDNQGEWSVWEVDGEKHGLFCQNLSLFAKLFLDNKSVFFDVAGFNYFLLVYTPPLSEIHPTPPTCSSSAPEPAPGSDNSVPTASNLQPSTSHSIPPRPRPQIVGFFSKEKMSWDNNNLACILVFPPWQRKGLGALLMGVSYEISRREGILGGPEKPISELGRKGYKRFWAGEITRWILELDLPATSTESAPTAKSARREKEKERDRGKDEAKAQAGLVDVGQCSRATWIVPEDCLAVLREMGVVEEAGLGSPGDKRDVDREGGADANSQGKEKDEKESKQPLVVPRVRVDKAAVRTWARENNIELTRACDPDGFVEGYAFRRSEGGDEGG